VSEAEELDRVVPLVAAVRAASDVIISVDTFRTEVARESIAAGANVINDTSGLHDPGLADLVAGSDATLVITHSLASPPRTPVPRPTYTDVVGEVAAFLRAKVDLALDHGVAPEQIIIDPGHDLNKNTRHTLELTRRLHEITAIGYPTLAAVSNKDFIGETLDAPQGQRADGTLAALVFCLLQGARIMRVHDVKAAIAATRMTEAILGWRPPIYTKHNESDPGQCRRRAQRSSDRPPAAGSSRLFDRGGVPAFLTGTDPVQQPRHQSAECGDVTGPGGPPASS
jgi:dihydropteroate synthase